MTWLNTWLCGPGAHTLVMDELEVGAQAAKQWASGNVGIPTVPGAEHRIQATPPRAVHYVPPAQYGRIRAEQAARAARARTSPPAPAPLPQPARPGRAIGLDGQLDLFAEAS